jgi:aryl-alcohol dehydrogenase-like predicted oxidoreductase/predicted kinase
VTGLWRLWAAGAAPPAAMGCMRLSTAPDRDETRAMAVLHAAFDAGVGLLDTADAYCHDHTEIGHNERLIARALATWEGDRPRIRIATKGGLTRPHGQWVADGRAKHLAAACEASRRALGVERIHLYQLHAPDPRTPLSTSVRALDSLKRDGLVEHVGLCNVTVGQIEEARQITDIAAVQVELSLWHDEHLLSGVVAHCLANDLALLAHRPLGGPGRRRRILSDPLLVELADRHDATPFEIALAWVRQISPVVTPIPGPTRVETARSVARIIDLRDEELARLDDRVPASRLVRKPATSAPARVREDGEVVLIMGLPAAGKSTLARALVAGGYARLNRDETGGSLASLLPGLDRLAASGSTRIVLDNTYLSRAARAAVIQAASRHRLPVRCTWLSTSVEDAQVNAVWRMLGNYGRLLTPEEIRTVGRRDPTVFGPTALFRCQRELEPPAPDEGFSRVDVIAFERRRDPSYENRAVILWCDDVVLSGEAGVHARTWPGSVEVFPGRAETLGRYRDDGWRLIGLSWRPEIAAETLTPAQAEAGFARMNDLLGLDIEVAYCPHAAGPPVCWCRKPLPGLGVVFIARHRLDAARCIYVGNGPHDPGFARRLGFQYREADEFFAPAA